MARAGAMLTGLVLVWATVVLCGCGGGSGVGDSPPNLADRSTLQGTLYTSGPIPAQAGQAPGARPLYDATVQLRRIQDNTYVADTMSSSTGRYHFPGLQRGLDLLIVVSARSGEVLMGRALLDAPTVTCDIDEDTTLVTRCQLLMRANGGGQTSADVESTVREFCLQFQQQHRYEYGDLAGERPDFTNQDAQWRAAAALLAAATDLALQQARGSANTRQCDQAVNMAVARLQAEGRLPFDLEPGVRPQIATALRAGLVFDEQALTEALSEVLGKSVTVGPLAAVRARMSWGCVQGRSGPLDIVEAIVAICCGACGEQNRPQSASQVTALVQALAG